MTAIGTDPNWTVWIHKEIGCVLYDSPFEGLDSGDWNHLPNNYELDLVLKQENPEKTTGRVTFKDLTTGFTHKMFREDYNKMLKRTVMKDNCVSGRFGFTYKENNNLTGLIFKQ